MNKTNQRNRHSTGFTLVEVIIAAFLSASLIVGAALLWYYFVNSFQFQFEGTKAFTIARDNVAQMVRELREMQVGEKGEYPLATANDDEIVFHSDIDNDGLVERVRYYLVDDQLIKQVFNYLPGSSVSYPCQGGCTICHNGGSTLNVDEHAWPGHAHHGDSLGACGTGGSTGSYGPDGVYEKVVADYITNGSRPIFTYFNGDYPGDAINNPLVSGNRLLHTRFLTTTLYVRTVEGSVGPKELRLNSSVQLRNLKDNL